MVSEALNGGITVSGIGIHTGVESRVTISPAPEGAGIVFLLQNRSISIPATTAFVVDTSRCTVLGKEGVTVSTVEHLMSALAATSFDKKPIVDVHISVDGPELPIGDGSAAIWVEALAKVQPETRQAKFGTRELSHEILVTGKNGSFIVAYPAPLLSLTVAAVFDHPLVGTQVARFIAVQDPYADSVASARTFGFIEEVEALRNAGLALGGSEDNAVIVYPDRYSRPPRFDNELSRHKLLDLIGDLALAGLPVPTMEIVAVKPSHRLNVEFARKVAEQFGS